MSNIPPAAHIKNPGRKPTWTKDQMEEAIDRYFQVRNFNRVAKECGVPVSTLFYKVKIDSRYQEDTKKVKQEEEKEPTPKSSPEVQGGLDWEREFEKVGAVAFTAAAAGAAFKGGSYLIDRLLGSEGIKKLLYGKDEEKVKAASLFCLSFILSLRKFTGLTDPFGKGIKPAHLTIALAYVLDLDSPKQTVGDQLVDKVARDWQDLGPLDEEIDLGNYRTVPASQVPTERKSKLGQFAKKRDLEIRAYLKDEKGGWAILTPSGKVVRYFPGRASTKDWMKALRWDYPESFG